MEHESRVWYELIFRPAPPRYSPPCVSTGVLASVMTTGYCGVGQAAGTPHIVPGSILHGPLMKNPLFWFHSKGNKLEKMKLPKVLQQVHGKAEVPDQVRMPCLIRGTLADYLLHAGPVPGPGNVATANHPSLHPHGMFECG